MIVAATHCLNVPYPDPDTLLYPVPGSSGEELLLELEMTYAEALKVTAGANETRFDVPETWCSANNYDVFFIYASIPEGGDGGDVEDGTVRIQFQNLLEQVPFAAHIFPQGKYISRYGLSYRYIPKDFGLGLVGGPDELPKTTIDYGEEFILEV